MRKSTFEIYRDRAREWRWRLRASNGKIVADSGEGYRVKVTAMRAVIRYQQSINEAAIKVI